MINFDDYANENKAEHNLKWPYIPDHPYRILIIGGSGSGKTNGKNIEEYNISKKRKVLIVFGDMIADMINNKKLNSVVTELLLRGRKLNISLVFMMQLYFKVPKDVRLNSTHFVIMKIPNKRELQQIALNH